MRASLIATILAFVLAACGSAQPPQRIALLAPFEGRYREVGYDALYAARLAMTDAGTNLHLMALDDGGTEAAAQLRLQALNADDTVQAIMLLGPFATANAAAQVTEKPVFFVGEWGHWLSQQPNQYLIGSTERSADSIYDDVLTAVDALPAVASGPVLALQQVNELLPVADGGTIKTAGTFPDDEYTGRLLESDLFVPQPGILSSLTYDTTRFIIQHVTTGVPISDMRYQGMNGTIQLSQSQWLDAPTHEYTYESGTLKQR